MRIEFTDYDEMIDRVMEFRSEEAYRYIPEGTSLKFLELSNNGDYENDVFGFRLVLPKKNVSIRLGHMYDLENGQIREETCESIIAIYELDEKDPKMPIEAYANLMLGTLIDAFPDVESDTGDVVGFIDTDELEYE